MTEESAYIYGIFLGWGERSVIPFVLDIGVSLTPKTIIKMNILKKTRKMKLLANAIGMIPKKVVAAPSMTDGPTSPNAFAIWTSFELSVF